MIFVLCTSRESTSTSPFSIMGRCFSSRLHVRLCCRTAENNRVHTYLAWFVSVNAPFISECCRQGWPAHYAASQTLTRTLLSAT